MKNNTRHLIAAGVFVIVLTIIVYGILTGVYALPRPASAEALPIDRLFQGHFVMIAVLFGLIMALMLYCVIFFRRRPGDDEEGVHFHGNTLLEISWTVAPLIIVVAFGIWGQVVLNDISEERGNELAVNVVGKQWFWEFEYEVSGVRTNNELVLPVNQPVRLTMTSQGLSPGDPGVLHAFWVPEFRVKRDLVPGQIYSMRITPTEEGVYKVRCAEICGTGHSIMLADVRVVSQAAFDEWLEAAAAGDDLADLSPAERGAIWREEFGCIGCHTVDGTPSVGPTWLGLYGSEEELADGSTVLVDEEYLYRSIVEPNEQIVAGFPAGVMPENYEELMSEEQILDVIEFIETLSEPQE